MVRTGPCHECPAGELRAVVCAHGQRTAPEDGSLVEQPCDVLPRDAQSTEMLMHSPRLKSSATGKHLMRRPVLRLSLTKSMLHTSLTVVADCSATRSLAGRLTFLRLRTARLAALYRR